MHFDKERLPFQVTLKAAGVNKGSGGVSGVHDAPCLRADSTYWALYSSLARCTGPVGEL